MKKIRIPWLLILSCGFSVLLLMLIAPDVFAFFAIPAAGVLPWVYMTLVLLLWTELCFWLSRVSKRLYYNLIAVSFVLVFVLMVNNLVDMLFFTSQSAYHDFSERLDTAKYFVIGLLIVAVTVDNIQSTRKAAQSNNATSSQPETLP